MRYIDADEIIFHLKCEMDRSVGDNNIPPVQCGIYFGLLYAKSLVDNAETADVQEVRHGKWIYCGHHEFHGHVFECSVCGRYLFANSKEDVYVEYPHCHCGAKMDEEEQK